MKALQSHLPLLVAVSLSVCPFTGANAEERLEAPFELAKPGLDVGVVVSDLEKAKRFYGGALGLTALPSVDAAPVAGETTQYQSGATVVRLHTIQPLPPAVEKGPMAANGIRLLTILTRGADATVQRFSEHGFEPPQFSGEQPGGFRLAFVQDPDGNSIELIAFGPDVPAEVLSGFQIGITVSDAERSRDFYGKVLGLEERPPIRLPDAIAKDTLQYIFKVGASSIKFWSPPTARPTRTGRIGDALGIRYLTFRVKDVDATASNLNARGVNAPAPPQSLNNGVRSLLVSDPDGNTIEFSSPSHD